MTARLTTHDTRHSHKPKPPSDRQLKYFATEFRRGILAGKPSDLMCFAICAPLQSLLKATHNLDLELVEGRVSNCDHFWLKLPDGRVLDPTADQFNDLGFPRMPKVYLGPASLIHSRVVKNADK